MNTDIIHVYILKCAYTAIHEHINSIYIMRCSVSVRIYTFYNMFTHIRYAYTYEQDTVTYKYTHMDHKSIHICTGNESIYIGTSKQLQHLCIPTYMYAHTGHGICLHVCAVSHSVCRYVYVYICVIHTCIRVCTDCENIPICIQTIEVYMYAETWNHTHMSICTDYRIPCVHMWI